MSNFYLKTLKTFLHIFFWPMMVLLVHVVLGLSIQIYYRLHWFDIPMHFLGGMAIGISMALLINLLVNNCLVTPLDKVIFYALVISLTASIAVFWEFFEYIQDQLFQLKLQTSLADTMLDLLLGILGGGLAVIYMHFKKK